MRFAIKNRGEEQTMDIGKLSTFQWRHVTLTISQDSIVAYTDGARVAATADITLRPADFNPLFNYIGRSQFKTDAMLKADIDDLRIYNHALSADEVAALFATTSDVEEVAAETDIVSTRYYTIDGKCHDTPQRGINMVHTQYSDGRVTVKKQLNQ